MSPLFLLFEYAVNLFVMVFLLRFLLQLGSADFFNPFAQFVHKVTAPLINAMRHLIPDIGKANLAAIVLALLLLTGKFLVIQTLLTDKLPLAPLLFGIFVGLGQISGLFMVFSNLLLILFIALMIASFMSGGRYHPGLMFLVQVTRPILAPVQRIIPPLGGTIDLSPMIILLGLFFLQSLLMGLGQKLLMP